MNPELAVEERLRRLESQVRRARMWSVAMTVALGAVVFASMQAPQAKELNVDLLRTRKLEVVDAAGRVRGALGPDPRFGEEDVVALILRGPGDSKPRTMLYTSGNSSELIMDAVGGRAYVFAATQSSGITLSSPPEGVDVIPGPLLQMMSEGGDTKLEMARASAKPDAASPRVTIRPELGLVRTGK